MYSFGGVDSGLASKETVDPRVSHDAHKRGHRYLLTPNSTSAHGHTDTGCSLGGGLVWGGGFRLGCELWWSRLECFLEAFFTSSTDQFRQSPDTIRALAEGFSGQALASKSWWCGFGFNALASRASMRISCLLPETSDKSRTRII